MRPARAASTTTTGTPRAALVASCLALSLTACELWDIYPWQARIPIEDVGAQFIIADTAWFEDEETLFVFYQVDANQGLSVESQIELTYRTDEEFVPFTPLHELEPVHTHLPALCGTRSLCGSYSVRVERVPRDVDMRLRYHRDGETFLDTVVDAHVILSGAPHLSRSAVVYGVFDRTNTHVQWRLRHQFPTIRNEHATELGLRRVFTVDDIGYGVLGDVRERFATNPYGYASFGACPQSFAPHEGGPLSTLARAVFDPLPLPIDAGPAPLVCAAATVEDARGTYTTAAFAQKNPETRQAFSELMSPTREARRVPFFLQVCADPTSQFHQDMQAQRLFLVDGDVVCIDDHATTDFPSRLAANMSARIDAAREGANDLVLTIALNRPNDAEIAARVEEALGFLFAAESELASPRLAGAFVFDTRAYIMRSADVARYTLWCPSSIPGNDLDRIPDASMRSCAVQAIQPIVLGELELTQLPILPTETQYETFIEKYGPGQTGNVTSLSFRTPTRTATSVNVPIGDFGVATFFNNEAITPEPEHAFSYCATSDTGLVVFRIDALPTDVFPLAVLGELHQLVRWPRYELGLLWDFPFLMRIDYNSTLATTVNLPDEIPFIVALGLSSPAEQFLGTPQWEQDRFEVGDALLECTRFCDHPTFDNARVYNVNDLFFDVYASQCYRPRYPALDDDGYPIDP